jgi:hypothetical protein
MKDKKLKLEYPCVWLYKIIDSDRKEMESAVWEIIPRNQGVVSFSRSSATAKYLCLNVEVRVESDTHRRDIYGRLQSHRAIKMVL